MSLSVCVVIRTSGERTIARCEQIVKEQLVNIPVIIIRESPFSAAVKKTFEIGIEHNKKWTLALDADILLRSNAVHDLVAVAEELPETFFMIQGRVLDKLFCFSRNGGPHLFRTSLIRLALPLVPDEHEVLRPEGETVRRMVNIGYHRYKGVETYGLHDFEQYYRDVFRTAFVHAIKFRRHADYLMNEWSQRESEDADYLVSKIGFSLGSGYTLANKPSAEKIDKFAYAVLDCLELKEKNVLTDFYDIDAAIRNFHISPEGRAWENSDHNKILRTDSAIKKKKSFKTANNILTVIGTYIEKIGKRIRKIDLED